MRRILFVNACVRPNSRTYILAQSVLEQLKGSVEEVCLEREKIEPLTRDLLQKRSAYGNANDFSDSMFQYAKQFAEADEIVIAAPYWDLAFPAILRIYLEAITIVDLTFAYTPVGAPIGRCKAKRIIYVTTAGGEIGDFNLGFDHVKALAQIFYGIQTVLCLKAENLDIAGNNAAAILEQAQKEIKL